MSMNFRKFAPLVKVNEVTREIDVRVTSERIDLSKEICDWATTRPFIEEYSESVHKVTSSLDGVEPSFGNVRVMHKDVIGGKFSAVVLDDVAKAWTGTIKVREEQWPDVMAGHFTGVSIGGEYVKRWDDPVVKGAKRYTAKVSEVSLVDRPCNEDATFLAVRKSGESEMIKFAPREVAQVWDCAVAGCLAKHAKKDDARTCLGVTDPAKILAEADLSKSLWTIANMATALATLLGVASDTEWEAFYEGDQADADESRNIRAIAQQLFDALAAMVADEKTEQAEPAMALAALTGQLAKSKTAQQLIKSLRVPRGNESTNTPKEAKDMDETQVAKMVATEIAKAFAARDAEIAKAAPVAKLAEPAGDGAMTKAATDVITKAVQDGVTAATATLAKQVETIDSSIIEMKGVITKMLGTPSAPKGALRAAPIEKKDDGKPETVTPSTAAGPVDPLAKALGAAIDVFSLGPQPIVRLAEAPPQ